MENMFGLTEWKRKNRNATERTKNRQTDYERERDKIRKKERKNE